MKLIKELLEQSFPNLNNNQKGLLISIFSSATPRQAYETSTGTPNATSAKNDLLRFGLIAQNDDGLVITQKGNEALLSNNLVDDMGVITDEGQKQLDDFTQNKQEYVNLESFDLFKSFYN